MNELRAMQITFAAQNSLAECERNEAVRLTACPADEKKRLVAGATMDANVTGPAIGEDERRSAANKASGKRHGKRKPPEHHGGNAQPDAESVAELIAIICNEPGDRRKRLKLAEALRERGLHESKLAAMYSGIAEKLSRNKEQGAVGVAAAKLLFDVLKELADWLEPEKIAGKSDVGEAPQFVRLIHNVPRPVRAE